MKKRFVKIISLTISAVMLAISLTACMSEEAPLNDGAHASLAEATPLSLNGGIPTLSELPAINNQASPSSIANTANRLTVFENGEYKVTFVQSASASALDKAISKQICALFTNATGVSPEIKTDSAKIGGPVILIGKTTYQQSTDLYSSVKTNQAKTSLTKDAFAIAYANESAYLVLYERLRVLVGTDMTDKSLVIDPNWNLSLLSVDSSKTSVNPPNKVIAIDQRNKKAVTYDMKNYSAGKTLENLEVSSFSIGHAAGIKYRENTVFGNVIIVAGTESGIYTTSGSKIWTTKESGKNPHSIELLPSGNLVIASSTDNKLRFFKTSVVKSGGTPSYVDYTLTDAHGVLWDPTYGVLWALGSVNLSAYRVKGSGASQELILDPDLSIELPEYYRGGHDLSPDYTDTRYLYIALGYRLIKFDKETQQMRTLAEVESVKGFSNNTAGNFFVTGKVGGAGTVWANENYQSWCTDTIYFCRFKADGTLEQIPIKTNNRAFYKIRAYCGAYQ